MHALSNKGCNPNPDPTLGTGPTQEWGLVGPRARALRCLCYPGLTLTLTRITPTLTLTLTLTTNVLTLTLTLTPTAAPAP